MLTALVPAASVAAVEPDLSPTAMADAEKATLEMTNRRRVDHGLVPLRLDSRMAAMARERAQYMADHDRFSHTQADGTTVFDLINDSDIRWYGAGEIIAWNMADTLTYSASFAVRGWMDSAPHRAIMLSKDYNYVGFGVAISPSTGKRYWAGVFLKGPDRTGAYAKIKSVSRDVLSATRTRVVVRWGGSDIKLQVLTSGFRYYQVQRRVNGGAWYSYGTTTRTSMTRDWVRGKTVDVRVRARDKAGNWGSWKQVTIKP